MVFHPGIFPSSASNNLTVFGIPYIESLLIAIGNGSRFDIVSSNNMSKLLKMIENTMRFVCIRSLTINSAGKLGR